LQLDSDYHTLITSKINDSIMLRYSTVK